jgi:hypothetical protein
MNQENPFRLPNQNPENPEEGAPIPPTPEYSEFTPVEGEKRKKLREELEDQGFPLNRENE